MFGWFCVALLCACAPTRPAGPSSRFFIPPLPAEPKIEGIGVYANDKDLKPPSTSLFSKIVGEDENVIGPDRPLSIASNGMGKVLVGDVASATGFVFDFNLKSVYTLGGDTLIGQLKHVTGVAYDSRGYAFMADADSRKIYIFNPENKLVKVINLSNQMDHIGLFAIDKTNNRIVAPDLKKHTVIVMDLDGKPLFSIGRRGDADGEFNMPNSVAVDQAGNIVVADSFNARIQRFDINGKFINKFGHRGDTPGDMAFIKGVAVDSEGHIYVTDGKENRITVFSPTGDYLLAFGRAAAQTFDSKQNMGGFFVPQGIYIDQSDRIYICDQLNGRFQVYQYLNPNYLSRFPIPK